MVNMRRLLILAMLLAASISEGSAQERIDRLLNRDIWGGDYDKYIIRNAVKHDPETGEVVKRVKELIATDNKTMAKELISAFRQESENAAVWEEVPIGRNALQITAIWTNPKRIYSLTVDKSRVIVNVQTIYHKEGK